MSEHTVKRFDAELSELKELVLRMGGLVHEQIDWAVNAVAKEDMEVCRDIIARDHVVNFMEVQADEMIVNLLALRQPMGSDLRAIMSLGKAVTDLERIGDEAERIARMGLQMFDAPQGRVPSNKLLSDAGSMATLAKSMLTDALDAFARLDVDLALSVAKQDIDLDNAFQSALRRLATYTMEDPRNVGRVIDATFIVKSLERIGDHAKNIAEHVIYLIKGKDVRHVSSKSLTEKALDGD
jgi:phosphate transport system protein